MIASRTTPACAAALLFLVAVMPSTALAQVRAYEGRVEPQLLARASACESGDHDACREVLRRYRARESLPTDHEVARGLLDSMCESIAYAPHSATFARWDAIQRRARPCFRVLADLDRAACDEGAAMSCIRLATAYEYGVGVAQNRSRARALLTTACAGDGVTRTIACEQLAEMRR